MAQSSTEQEKKPESLTAPAAPGGTAEKSEEKTASIVTKMIDALEQTYQEEKAKEIQELYNAFVDVLATRKAHISNVLTALELVKHNVVDQKIQQIRTEQG